MNSDTVKKDKLYSWRGRIMVLYNVPTYYKAQDILLMCRQFGRIFRVDLARNELGKSRGFAYCEFERQDAARMAVKYLDGGECDGRALRAELADLPPNELVKMYV